MNLTEILFWCITVPSLYLGGACLSYKILRKTLYKDMDDRDEAEGCRIAAGLWIVCVPLIILFVGIPHALNALFDMIETENKDQNDGGTE